MAAPCVVDLQLGHPLRCVAVRPAPCSAGSEGGAQQQGQAQQVLLFTDGGCFELLGLDAAGSPAAGFAAGGQPPALGPRVGPPVLLGGKAPCPCPGVLQTATYDASSRLLYVLTDDGLVRVNEAGGITGTALNSAGLPFAIRRLSRLAADGFGFLFAIAEGVLFLLVDSAPTGGPSGGLPLLGRASLDNLPAAHIVFDPWLGRLYVATDRAIYRVRGTTATLLAGGAAGVDPPCRDGVGGGARFGFISRLMTGRDGCLYVADGLTTLQLRRVTSDGVVITLQLLDWDLTRGRVDVALLPYGWLAIFDFKGTCLRLLQTAC